MNRILFLNYEFPPLGGGAGNATMYLFNQFAKIPGLEIELVTSSTSKEKIEKFSNNITIHYLDIGKKGNIHYQSNKDLLRYSWKAYWYSKALLKKKKFCLVHAFFGIPCGYIAMKLGLPYIVSLRGSDVPFYNSRYAVLDKLLFQCLSRRIWKNAHSVVANSQDLKQLALRTFKGEIEVIPNGVDTNEFKPSKKLVRKGKIRLVSTGRLISRKGYQFLIPALAGMKNFELTLVGGGNMKEELKSLAKANKVKVNFAGEVKHDKIKEYLRDSDIFILPSLNEGMSNSILEAMACGLPIITTDTGGCRDLVKGNGFIIEKSNSKNIKAALQKYLADTKLLDMHANKSRSLAEGMDWQRVADSYVDSYSINKRVMHIIDHMGLGGAQRVVSSIANEDKHNNHIVFTLKRKKDQVAMPNIRHARGSVLSIYSLAKIVQRENFRTVHCHLAHAKLVGYFLKLLVPSVQLIYHEHGSVLNGIILQGSIQKISKRQVDKYIAVSESVRRELISCFKLDQSKVVVLYNPIDKIFFHKKRTIPEKVKTIGFAGRIVERKGWREFVEAAKIIAEEQQEFKFTIAGDGEDRSKLLGSISGMENVEYVGQISNMPEFYKTIDCLVVPSHWEPMGLVQLEAQASGVPVVASDVSGLNEVINDKIDALLFESKNVKELVEKIYLIQEDDKLKEKLVKNGYQNAERYSLKRYLVKLTDVYEK